MKNNYYVIGVMSGTSLDGVDVAYCRLSRKHKSWKAKILTAKTYGYSPAWQAELSSAHQLSVEALLSLHTRYGKWLGQTVKSFIKKEGISKKVELIASHGHTIFHQPGNHFTFQLGDGNALHAQTKIPVASDFRSLDIALGGEGAPLVPIGDALLFADYDICLNLGGIGNLSIKDQGEILAYDFCYCNMALNHLAAKAGKRYDNKGKLARQGTVNEAMLARIGKIYAAYRQHRPSLRREGFEKEMLPLLEDESIPLNDRLRTICESVANELAFCIPLQNKKLTMLATGGGTLNDFLIERMEEKLAKKVKLRIPEKKIIAFKEALVFAFLGVLRLRGEINSLKSVTGASRDSCSGVLTGI